MKISSTTFALFQLGAVLLVGCKDHGSDVDPVKQEPVPVVLNVEMDPASGWIGSPLTLRCPGFVLPGRNYMVYFPGADDYLYTGTTSDSVISTFVPFGARSGKIIIAPIGDGQGRTGDFHIDTSIDTTTLSVAPYDISPPITAKDSSVIDYMGFRRSWRADRQGDTLHIQRRHSTDGKIRDYHFVLIDQGTPLLPRLAAVWTHVDTDYSVAWDDTNHVGVLKLQDYNTHGVISGRFFTKPSAREMLNGTIAFWVDLGR
jgi:hypothetical protein